MYLNLPMNDTYSIIHITVQHGIAYITFFHKKSCRHFKARVREEVRMGGKSVSLYEAIC